jgi:uncharacterized protein
VHMYSGILNHKDTKDTKKNSFVSLWFKIPELEQEIRKSSISIIIPTLNEADNIVEALRSAQGVDKIEIIVVDCGSNDNTVGLAKSCGAKVLFAPKGRAIQMNTGAAAANGDILLFLHADMRLPKNYDKYINQILSQSNNVAGAFEFRIDGSSPWLRLIEQMVRWRSTYLQTPYGDQAIFLRADLFRKMGGFPEISFMEDFELVRRLRRLGHIGIAPAPAITSARRWNNIGIWKTTIINQLLIAAYLLGVAPSRIGRWYYSHQSQDG